MARKRWRTGFSCASGVRTVVNRHEGRRRGDPVGGSEDASGDGECQRRQERNRTESRLPEGERRGMERWGSRAKEEERKEIAEP